MNEAAAKAVLEGIRTNIVKSYAHRKDALQDIVRVYKEDLWKVLKYDSFEACLTEELRIERFPLRRADRREMVEYLAMAGLTTRAISAALGVSDGAVQGDRNHVFKSEHVNGDKKEPTSKVGLDGKTYQSSRKSHSLEEVADQASRETVCLTPKMMNAFSSARDIGAACLEAGTLLMGLVPEDLADLDREELQRFQNDIYRVRTSLRNACEIAQKGVELHNARKSQNGKVNVT